MSDVGALPWRNQAKWKNWAGIIATAAVLAVYFVAMDLSDNLPDRPWDIEDPIEARNFVNVLARASVTLISTVLASLFLAIPLTANNYTPQLIELIIRSWTHRIVLGLFVFSAGFAVWLTVLLSDKNDQPRLHIAISVVLVLFSLVALLPYLFSVLRLLDPDVIIRLVADNVIKAMRPQSPVHVARAQLALERRIGQLGNIILRSIDRSDRDTALTAIEALEGCALHYLRTKNRQAPEWFRVDSSLFPGLSPEAIKFLSRDRNWVEMDLLHQLSRSYGAALAKMPDVLSAICRTNRHFAVAAAQAGDIEALDLTIRYFNNSIREAVKRKDLHALYDTIFQYRGLAARVFEFRPDRVERIAKYLDYYGRMALAAGIPFAYDLVAYDLGGVIAAAAGRREADVSALLKIFLGVGRPSSTGTGIDLSPGMVKARLILAATLSVQGRHEAAANVRESLSSTSGEFVQSARRELLANREESFWEVTDRQQNIDWIDDTLRQHL